MNTRLSLIVVVLCALAGCNRSPSLAVDPYAKSQQLQGEAANRKAADVVLSLDWVVTAKETRLGSGIGAEREKNESYALEFRSEERGTLKLLIEEDHRFRAEFGRLDVGGPVTFVHLPHQGGDYRAMGTYLAPHCDEVLAYCKRADLSGY